MTEDALPDLRASDADRERTADLLRHAAGEGRLTLEELDERLTLAYATRTQRELARLTADVVVPEEIERVLPAGVAVVGIQSAHWGEVIVAVSEAEGLDEAVAQATAGLARYKHPRACLTIETLPRSLQGKIQRARVRELVLSAYTMTDGPYPKFERR